MERIFSKRLDDWKVSPNRKPLIVRGARQVGKTYTIKQFGSKNFPRKVRAASPASLPLGAMASEKKFKAILVDIGLMRKLNDLPANLEYTRNDLLSMYNGTMAEQFAGQEFISSDMNNLYYWSRDAKSSSAEVDYLITRNNKIFPVEINGGASGKLRSMHMILKQNPHIEQAYVLSTTPFGKIPEQKLTFLPLYYAYGLSMSDSTPRTLQIQKFKKPNSRTNSKLQVPITQHPTPKT